MLSVVLSWLGHLQAGKEVCWNRGVAGRACCVFSVWVDQLVPVGWYCVEADFFCRVRILVGSTCACRRRAVVS